MTTLYEYFNCNGKEELYLKIKTKDKGVQSLLDFIEFSKGEISNKNKPIRCPEDGIKYLKTINSPEGSKGSILFLNNKNCPIHLKTINFKEKIEIKEAIKEGIIAGSHGVLISHSEEFSYWDVEEKVKDILNTVGIKTLDVFSYNKNNNNFYSWEGKKNIDVDASYSIIHEKGPSYKERNIEDLKNFKDFFTHYSTEEMKNLNINDDFDKIRELIKIGYQHHDQEIAGIITYDDKNSIISAKEMFKGGTNISIVDVKLITKELIKNKTKGIIFFHNHPSGDPAPSGEDISVTKKIKKVCDFLDIELLDHLISTKERTLSFVEEGYLIARRETKKYYSNDILETEDEWEAEP